MRKNPGSLAREWRQGNKSGFHCPHSSAITEPDEERWSEPGLAFGFCLGLLALLMSGLRSLSSFGTSNTGLFVQEATEGTETGSILCFLGYLLLNSEAAELL